MEGIQMIQFLKNNFAVSSKHLKCKIFFDPVTHLGIYSLKVTIWIQYGILRRPFHCSSMFVVANIWKAPNNHIGENGWIN